MREELKGNKSTIRQTAKENVKIRPERERIKQAQIGQTHRHIINRINGHEQLKGVAVNLR